MSGSGPEWTGSGGSTTSGSSASATADETTIDPDGSDSSEGSSVDCRNAQECVTGEVCLEARCASCTDADDPDAACGGAYPELGLCGSAGRCVACDDGSCSADTPVCDPLVGCVACTEHVHCPDSACHLGGPDAGTCFSTDDVVEVQTPGAFAELLDAVGPGEDRVFVLGAATYTFPMGFDVDVYDIDGQREIAFIGNGATILRGNVGANHGFLFGEPDESQVYLFNLDWDGVSPRFSPGFPILEVGPDAELWMDDVTARACLLMNDGTAHLRRSNLLEGVGTPFGFPDAGIQGGGSLYLENASLDASPNLTHFRFNGLLDIRYSTIVVEEDFLCGADTTGIVRNSIVLSGGVVDEGCEGATWTNNAVNEPGYGQMVPAFDSSWLVPTGTTRFNLSAAGAAVFEGVAQWGEGDPLTDVEGDPRPMRGPSTAGVDEP